MLVVFFHAKLGFAGGFIGVDMFFVISGFLITGIIIRQHDKGTFSLKEFWIRRIRRIMPAALSVSVVTLCAGYFLLSPADYVDLANSSVCQQLMMANIYFWRNSGYFAGSSEVKPLLHTWSLSVEEQFYLFYPLVLLFLRQIKPLYFVAVFVILGTASFTVSELALSSYADATFYLLPTRAWELALGGLLAILPPVLLDKTKQRFWLGIVGLACIVGSAVLLSPTSRFPGFLALPPCLGTALVIISNSGTQNGIGRLLAYKPLVFIGLLSYSLYLWHWPLLAFSRYWFGENLPTLLTISILFLLVFIAWLSWRYIETPFRLGNYPPTTRVLIGTIVCVWFTSGCIGFWIISERGFSRRAFSSIALQYQFARDSRRIVSEPSIREISEGKLPHFGAATGGGLCLVWGDSHAMALIPGIDAACKDVGIRGVQATRNSTAPLVNLASIKRTDVGTESRLYSQAVLDYIHIQHVDLVVMSAIWSRYANLPGFETALNDTLRVLSESGVKIAIVLDVATNQESVPMLLAKAQVLAQPVQDVGVRAIDYELANNKCNSLIRRAAKAHQATVLDPSQYLTDEQGKWRAELDGQVIYRDRTHLTVEGGLRLKPLFENYLRNISVIQRSNSNPP
jgi:peptidoglycan/LPS O-acetylase OafA/YrhL